MSTHILNATGKRLVWVVCCGLMLLSSGCARAQTATAPDTTAPRDPWMELQTLYAYDKRAPLDLKTIDTQEGFAATTKRITIRGVRGATVPLLLVMPSVASAQNKVPALVLLHGKGGTIDEMLILGQLAAARGFASVIPEIVDHGARRDRAKPLFGGDATRLREGFIESIGDIRRALDVLVAQPEVDSRRIGLVGLSLGAIMGSVTTGVDNRIATAVLIVGGADWRLILGQSSERDATERRTRDAAQSTEKRVAELALLDAIDPKNFVGHIAPRPVLMINGTKDTIIPAAASKALFEAAREPKKQVFLPYDHFLPPTEVAPIMQAWLDQNLKNAKLPTPVEEKTGASISASPEQAATAPELIPTVVAPAKPPVVKAPIVKAPIATAPRKATTKTTRPKVTKATSKSKSAKKKATKTIATKAKPAT